MNAEASAALSGDVSVGRLGPASGENTQRCRSALSASTIALLIAHHPHFLEIDVNRRQIFRDIVLVLDAGSGPCAAGQHLWKRASWRRLA